MTRQAAVSHPVIWTEGLFLRPQHFQQQQLHADWLLQERLSAVFAFGWGFRQLAIDESHLRSSKLGIRQASGVFPDGTAFTCPSADCPLAAMDVSADVRDQLVHLRIFLQRPDVPAVALDAKTAAERQTRFVALHPEVADRVAGFDLSAEVLVGQLRVALILDSDVDGSMSTLPVARIRERKPTGEVVLDPDFLPPLLDAMAHVVVRDWIYELQGVVKQRAEMLAGRLGESSSKGPADFLLLHLCNRYAPLLAQWAGGSPLHPYSLHQELLKFAGECASFDTAKGRLAPSFPQYRHDALVDVLLPPIDVIRRVLTNVAEQTAFQIPIRHRGRGLFSAEIPDPRMFQGGRFVLGASAQVDERKLREALPALIRICGPNRLEELTRALVQGIQIQPLPGTPSEVRWHAHFVYFQLDGSSPEWSHVRTSRQMALLAHGEQIAPGLEFELWYIR